MRIDDNSVRVDRHTCVACGTCVDRCIMDNLRLSIAPCRQVCPVNMNCQGYMRLIAEGKYEEAKNEIKKHLPFASILGRVCDAPCESVCERGKIDGAVQIRALKRYLADGFITESDLTKTIAPESGKKVAIVGSGPAGLMAAWLIRKQGHHVIVFEADEKPGGLLRYGIPESRLPGREVESLIQALEKSGIKFQISTRIGTDLTYDQLKGQVDACILAVGGGGPSSLSFPGVEHSLSGLIILKQSSAGQNIPTGKRIAIIGGGNTAVDTAIIYRRMGVEQVEVIYRKTLQNLRAFQRSIREAVEEGVIFRENLVPVSIQKLDDDRKELKLCRSALRFDSDTALVHTIDNSECHQILVDQVILAVGQSLETTAFPSTMIDSQIGTFKTDPVTLQANNHQDVFVCGDAINHTNTVVHALASGEKAAESLNRYLEGESLTWERDQWARKGWIKEYEAGPNLAQGIKRCSLEKVDAKDRSNTEEIEIVLNKEQATREANRCLNCGRAFEKNQTCWYCLPCELECPHEALEVRIPYLVR